MSARPAPGGMAPEAIDAPLDRQAGLERVMGDGAMYLRVLTRFHNDYHDTAARLRAALGAGDLALAQRIAHTLKGAAAMIEAHCLRQLAADTEHALRMGAGVEPAQLEGLENELARVIAHLGMLLPAAHGAADAAGTGMETISGTDLARLCALLDTGDSAAQDVIDGNDTGLRNLLGAQRMAQLQAAMAAFDFEGALRVLRPGHGH